MPLEKVIPELMKTVYTVPGDEGVRYLASVKPIEIDEEDKLCGLARITKSQVTLEKPGLVRRILGGTQQREVERHVWSLEAGDDWFDGPTYIPLTPDLKEVFLYLNVEARAKNLVLNYIVLRQVFSPISQELEKWYAS